MSNFLPEGRTPSEAALQGEYREFYQSKLKQLSLQEETRLQQTWGKLR